MGMSLPTLLWLAVGGVIAAAVDFWALVVYLFGVLVGYLFSLRVHPTRRCWRCGGSGKHSGYIWSYAQRSCESCGGSGRRPRWGRRFMGGE